MQNFKREEEQTEPDLQKLVDSNIKEVLYNGTSSIFIVLHNSEKPICISGWREGFLQITNEWPEDWETVEVYQRNQN